MDPGTLLRSEPMSRRSGEQPVTGMVTRFEAARILNLSVKRVDQLRQGGHLASVRNPLTGKVFLPRAEVEALAELRGDKPHRWIFRRSA